MKTQYTPGPWKAKQQFYDEYSYVVLWPDKNGEHMKRIDANGEFKKQDANLIAAAPDMLEALEGALKALRKALPFLPADNEAVFCGEWLDEIKEVIAKAKGE